MNIITYMLIEQVLDSFKSDSTGLPNTNETRATEFKDCDTTFEAGFKMVTLDQMKECYDYGIYRNSFSKWRSRFDESGRISLTNQFRDK